MDKIFKAHRKITSADFEELWEKCLFIFDTNVLLDLYRFPESARRNVFDILAHEKIKTRVWIPFQVALEYINNRLEVVGEQKNKFNQVRSIIEDGRTSINKLQDELLAQINSLQLKRRHSVITTEEAINEKLFDSPRKILESYLEKLKELETKQPDVQDEDVIQKKINEVFDDKIGPAFTKEEVDGIAKEGEARYKDEMPPGYKDKSKAGYHIHDDLKIPRKFGDLFVWKEIIKKAKTDKLQFITFVTSDAKDDWWREERGKRISPRYELLNEVYFESKDLKFFHIYDIPQFMTYAQTYLKIDVSATSIQEAKDVIEFKRDTDALATSVKESIQQYLPGLLAESELERFIRSIFSDRFSSRTIAGINKESGIGKERIKTILNHLVDHGFVRKGAKIDGRDYWKLKEVPVRIYSAAYKWQDGHADVSSQIKRMVLRGVYQGLVVPKTFDIVDPAYGIPKTLVIHCRIHGIERELSFRDGETFKIE